MWHSPSILAPVLKSSKSRAAKSLKVSYSGTWTSAQRSAFNYAVDVWNNILNLNTEIEIKASLSDLGAGRLGGAAPTYLALVSRGANLYWVPGALGNQINGSDVSTSSHEITLSLGTDIDWYYGTDGRTPRSKVDFVSVVMHEICHGLGFFGSAKVGNSCGNSDVGCYGRQSQDGNVYAWYYDQFVEDRRGRSLLSVPNYSSSLKQFLQGETNSASQRSLSGNLMFSGTSAAGFDLFTPSNWMQGSSYSHLDDRNEMMYYAFGRGHAKHHPGRALNVLKDLGYDIAESLLPIILENFEAIASVDEVDLLWNTVTELSSSHFEVQRSTDGFSWTTLETVDAQGYALTPSEYSTTDQLPYLGTNYYRLKMHDQDGSSEFSGIQSIEVKSVPAEVLLYPTPAHDALHLQRRTLDGALQYQIVAVTGEVISSGTTLQLKETIDVSELAQGYYVLQCIVNGSRTSHKFLKS